ncbi:uncharacterized protein LOC114943434 [Nylanderia fulva]|uniref:uncharacterized protein LOC114943434 n=1 Tax=Nylanderia fulva TaxID=613905 RepID=UPI0010FB25DB|nr:uncharacterized protein LOC114943434 [Nylanderia fulva]XP_029174982.1 uncharacterized protein LOC114943434 [Nylanderia fulva]
MQRRIMILLVASALILAVQSANPLRCYSCISLHDKNCNSSISETNSLQVKDCTIPNLREWQTGISKHATLGVISQYFYVDDPRQPVDYQTHIIPMACAKIDLKINNKDVTIRTCQTAKTKDADPCEKMRREIHKKNLATVEQCHLCVTDICNGSTLLSPEIFYILLSFLGAFIHVAFYYWA